MSELPQKPQSNIAAVIGSAFNITCQNCGKDCNVYEQVNTAQIGGILEWWCYCEECDVETFHPC
jgi:hypothetical protein